MSKRSIYNQLRIPSSQETQIRAFTAASQRGIYAGTIRAEAARLGYGNVATALTDPEVLAEIDGWAADVARSIVTTYNRMLQDALAQISGKLSDQGILRALQPFLDSVAKYNRDVLIPYTSAWTRQLAINDFYRLNNIDATWSVDPPDTNQVDVCLEAIQASPMSKEQASAYFFPAHQRCPHRLVPSTTGGLPNVHTLWRGQARSIGATA